MSDDGRTHRLDLLILARVAGASVRTAMTTADLRRTLARYTGAGRSPVEVRRELDGRIDELERRGYLVRRPLAVTAEGRAWLCQSLGIDRPPAWTNAKNRLFPMLGLGMEPGSKEARHAFSGTDTVQASILARAHDLPLPNPTLPQVINALTARALGTARPLRTSADLRPAIAELWVTEGGWRPDRSGSADGRPRSA